MGRLRLVTANLYNGRAEPDAVAKLLDETRPDVVTAQELAPNAAAVIAERLPYGVLDAREDYEGRGVALRLPGVAEPVSLAHRPSWFAVLDPAVWPMLSAPLEVLSMHLVSPVSPPPWRSVPLRIDQLSDLQAHLEARPGINRIVAGDMNASPVWPAYRRLTSMMRDGLAQAGPTRRTWGPYWWSPRVLRIDHVLVSGVTVVDSRVVVIRGSDHSAIVADIEV